MRQLSEFQPDFQHRLVLGFGSSPLGTLLSLPDPAGRWGRAGSEGPFGFGRPIKGSRFTRPLLPEPQGSLVPRSDPTKATLLNDAEPQFVPVQVRGCSG